MVKNSLLAPGGIEPTTFALLARRSNQLSYGAIVIKLSNVLNSKFLESL